MLYICGMKELIKNKYFWIAVSILILFSFYQCNDTSRLQGQYDVLKRNYELSQQKVSEMNELRLEEKTRMIKENDSLLAKNEKLQRENTSLYKSISKLREKTKKEVNAVAKMSFKQKADKINTIYETNKASATDSSVVLSGEKLTTDIITDVVEKEACEEENKIKDEIISNKDQELQHTNQVLENTEIMLETAEKQITAEQELNKNANENIKNLEKQNRRVKRKSTVNTILIGVGAVGGYLIGKEL